ncbi:unnamed protein product [Adineta steineri]|uniref:EamA domain-containing protein n=1 Tax=Adineta steineri TaxID=433720 RepID=A0A819HVD6_9BILA|nr:unnamed protein product [Adineta steineri]CAF3902073.1 unnamed protein product [Adineta steineri]
MNITEHNNSNQEHLLVSSTAIDNDNVVKLRRSSSILTVAEPALLLIATEEDDNDDGETVAVSKLSSVSGILYGILGSFFYVTPTFIIKELQIDLLDAVIIRIIVQIPLCIIFVIYRDYTVWIGSLKEKWLQFILCILSCSLFLGYFIGLRYLPFPDFTTLVFTRLMWTIVFGILLYKEKSTMMILLSVCFTFIGVVFVAQPTFIFKQNKIVEITPNITRVILNETNIHNMYYFNDRTIGTSLALMTGLVFAFSTLILKQLITLKIKSSALILQQSFALLVCLIFNQLYKYFLLNDITFFTLIIFQWKYWLAGLISLIQIFGIICAIRALSREPPSIITIVSASDIIFAVLLQNLFTKNKSNLWVLLGSALILSSVIFIGLHKFMQEQKAKKKRMKMAMISKTET